jgi:hypothetical protein
LPLRARRLGPCAALVLAFLAGAACGAEQASLGNQANGAAAAPRQQVETMRMSITIGDDVLTATLNDSAAAREFDRRSAGAADAPRRAARLRSEFRRHHLLCAVGQSRDLLPRLQLFGRSHFAWTHRRRLRHSRAARIGSGDVRARRAKIRLMSQPHNDKRVWRPNASA